jgi:anti-sigma regulatory factor (Ser/Thr protein kinase)
MSRFESNILATPEAISELTGQVMDFLAEQGVETRATHHVALVLDEVLMNLGTHGNCRDQPAKITLIVEPDKVIGEVVDTGPSFDPRTAPDPSLDLAASDRPIGGLGLYLVRKLSATLEYARRNDENCTTFAITRGK